MFLLKRAWELGKLHDWTGFGNGIPRTITNINVRCNMMYCINKGKKAKKAQFPRIVLYILDFRGIVLVNMYVQYRKP